MASKYQAKVQNLTDYFSSLVNYAEKLAFPDYRDGVLSPQDTQQWGVIRKFLHQVIHTTFSIDNFSLWNILLFPLWAYFSAASLALGVIFIQPRLYNLTFPSILPYSLIHDTTTIVITTILAILVLPVAIYWWYEVITENRYHIILKIILAGLFFYLLFAFSKKFDFDNLTLKLWFDSKSGLLRAYGLHFAPAITYFMAVGLDSLFSVYYLAKVIFGGVISIHNPLPFSEIRKLLLEVIPYKDNKEPWRMSTLTASEVKTISDWAKANRDATEKRTIPISIGLGLAGFIAISGFVRSTTDNLISNWFGILATIYKSPFSVPLLTSIFNLGLFFLLIAFIMLVVISLVRLFVNLTVQNIIIETCIVAQHSKSKTG